ncbi:phage terminase large subunit [Pontibacter burrus]|uniref:Phage terminase large subunit n=1 Tax=Pontibacter burrus TaxID=2704466 RepID=A0A6B3LM79_9BACT|nr:phage terminase large subunit [Pontibacter burrus]NEM96175.1 phage terminase large subunit [Pontibacter burrus]
MEESRSSFDTAINAALCKASFYEFFLEFWDTIEAVELVPNWHIRFICDELQKVYETWAKGLPQDDVIINVPPGSSKSTIVTQLFPAWLWVKDPSIRLISSSYAADLSIAHAVKTRDCLKSDKFQAFYPGLIEFKKDSDGKSAFKNTRKGERFTTSTGGRVTGMHGDFIINDDPINPEEAESAKARETANRFSGTTLSTRKTNKKRTVTIMVMQRLHELDPTGDWLKKKKSINHICLPGELSEQVKPERVRQYYVNGLLDANRLDRSALDKLKEDLGSYGYAGQIGQTPTPDGGGKLKKAWFGRIGWEEFQKRTLGRQVIWHFDADTAYTKDQKNDPTAMMASCYIEPTLYIRDVQEAWLEFPELIKELPAFVKRNGYSNLSKLHIEPKASGKSTIQTLKRETSLNIVEAPTPEVDKVTRVNGIAPFVEAGRVVLIDGSWNDNFLGQCAAFPLAAHDDMVDDLVQAVNRIHQPVKRIKAKTVRR